MNIKAVTDKVLGGIEISPAEAAEIYDAPIDELSHAANEIRKKYCGSSFDICTIINGKSGKCSENCKYCAQSSFYGTAAEEYPLLDTGKLLEGARRSADSGILRYSVVTSGRRLSGAEIDRLCESVSKIKASVDISVCVSSGLLNEEEYCKLKSAGVSRIHNNIETSERNFPNICTTHTFQDKVSSIEAAKRAGLEVCSGGIMGLGEAVGDRIDMAFVLRRLGVRSVPINMLNPIPGTPFENNPRLTSEDMRRICAVFRFILPDASIRLAGGRGLMEDKGVSCFLSGANSAISGDMLTTSGISISTDMEMLEKLGYRAALCS